MKNVQHLFSVLVFAFLLIGNQAFAEIPIKLDQIPIIKGMKLISEEKYPSENGLIFGVRRIYQVLVPIEEIVASYEKSLEINKRFEESKDQNNLKVGEYVKPTIQVYFWDDTQFVDGEYGEGGSSKRAWIKKELLKRKKDKENKWIESANAEWYYRDTEKTMTTLHLMIQDLSIDEESNKYSLNTEVIIEVLNYDYEL